ncbi:hypothetical protein F8S13_24350 [Chloroflexia bacterium SDU3-3]|nr:hypothetical protein F8S13_24350 [Chloroflexia bacterium SDU3-3]
MQTLPNNPESSEHTLTVDLHAISGLRGAMLTFLPLLLITLVFTGPLMVWGVVDGTPYESLWYSAFPLMILITVAISIGIRRSLRSTSITFNPNAHTMRCATRMLGRWSFALTTPAQIETYDHTNPRVRQQRMRGQIVTGLLVALLVLLTAIIRTPPAALGLVGMLFMGWLMHRAEQTSASDAGLILWIQKANAHMEPHRIHITAAPETIQRVMIGVAASHIDSSRPPASPTA